MLELVIIPIVAIVVTVIVVAPKPGSPVTLRTDFALCDLRGLREMVVMVSESTLGDRAPRKSFGGGEKEVCRRGVSGCGG